jgi:hypothetical protein
MSEDQSLPEMCNRFNRQAAREFFRREPTDSEMEEFNRLKLARPTRLHETIIKAINEAAPSE